MIRLIPIILKEGRKEELKKKYSDKYDEEVLDWILNISDLVDFNHKYTDFVLREIDPNTDIAWWAEKIIEDIKLFDKYRSQLQKKDINQYSDLYELEDAIFPLQQKEKEKQLESQVDKIYEDDRFLVVKPKTEEASCKYGSNTKWCVTSKGSGHFDRYTQGNQGLYFIINKLKSSDTDYSKIAIHFNNEGNITYWDAQDYNLGAREIKVLNYFFPQVIEAIKKDYQSKAKDSSVEILNKIFNHWNEVPLKIQNTDNISGSLKVKVSGFEMTDDHHEFGRAVGVLDVYFNGEPVDKYDIFVTFNIGPNNTFISNFDFSGYDENVSESFVDCGLEKNNISIRSKLLGDPIRISDRLKFDLSQQIIDILENKPQVKSFFEESSLKSWSPNRINYGYTFEKNKGLIKNLVDWLDSGKTGTKLDFLTDIGKMKRKIVNNRAVYSRIGSNEYSPSSNWRGQLSSFFASAKLAKIISYRKVSNQFFLTKGPNFETFKRGELKAI